MRTTRRKEFDINHLNVASPCPVSWETMTGDERSRDCSQCDHKVYNIAGMGAEEIFGLLSDTSDRVCVRLMRRSDGTVMTKDRPKGLAAYRKRVATFAGAAFAAMLGLFSAANGQRPPVNDSLGTRSETSVAVPMIEGVVKDPSGKVIPEATVTITTAAGKKLTLKTNVRGEFRITSPLMLQGENDLLIEAMFFTPFGDRFLISAREKLDFSVIMETGIFVGVVVVESPPRIDTRKSEISTTFRIDRD